jgi:hypothetical protein
VWVNGYIFQPPGGRAVALLMVQGPNDVGDVEVYAGAGHAGTLLGQVLAWPPCDNHPLCAVMRACCGEVMVVTSIGKVVNKWVISLVGRR